MQICHLQHLNFFLIMQKIDKIEISLRDNHRLVVFSKQRVISNYNFDKITKNVLHNYKIIMKCNL